MDGKAVGFHKSDEAASKAVDHKRAAPGTFTELGGQAVAIGGSGSSGLSDKDVSRAREKADKNADARASLFARPGGGASAAAAGAADSAPATDQEPPADDAFGFGGEDVDAAFAAMSGGQGGEAAAGGGGQEDDLGLM